ncbi:MAG: hypothetical protein GOMPHAMPRED_002250 [Gomphillus americanus]|uniref:Uncharacterized protein n=1 Tax=Gomphillus americanus TaxID=1940652 RepID=A0A8H3FCR7_9LECA|nr:MAG: hypothetical protein GOMPHAMPRED_002250 [Gomphillus americanus]
MVSAGLKQSASKEEFIKALGMNALNPTDNAILKEMWEEVTVYWNKHFETPTDRKILKPEYAGNDKIQKPYKWAHLDPAFIDQSIAEVWQAARPGPRHYYELGRSEDRKVFNWVLKWLLWHVCRYRDWRNRKAKPTPLTVKPVLSTTVTAPAESSTLPPRDYWTTVLN